MKRLNIFIIGLSFVAFSHLHSMEQTKLRSILNKEQQKEFRDVLAKYRASYVYEQFLYATNQIENAAEQRSHRAIEEELNQYKDYYDNKDKFVTNAFRKLEKFKNKEVNAYFQNRQNK
jgi:hypothetical protein